MGQDQSATLRTGLSPDITPSTSTSNRSLTQSKTRFHQQYNEEGSSMKQGEETDERIIQVVEQSEEESDEELRLLKSIKKFEPFIKEQEKGFNLESLLKLKSTKSLSTSSEKKAKISDTLDPLFNIYTELQTHLKHQMSRVNTEQRILLRRIAYMDQLAQTCALTVNLTFAQSKAASEKVSDVAVIREQALKAQELVVNVFKTLSELEKYLDPEDRTQIQKDANEHWPELNRLRVRASKSNASLPFEKILKSAVAANDVTTMAGSSTSPLLEKVVVAGEQATQSESVFNDPIEMKDATAQSVSTSSLALSRLRGLSSRSTLSVSKQ